MRCRELCGSEGEMLQSAWAMAEQLVIATGHSIVNLPDRPRRSRFGNATDGFQTAVFRQPACRGAWYSIDFWFSRLREPVSRGVKQQQPGLPIPLLLQDHRKCPAPAF